MKREFTDHLQRKIFLRFPPERIVSLCPSQTETLVTIGAADQLVGITAYCIHPPDLAETKKIVGGTKKINRAKLAGLKPDLVIAEKEENTRKIVEELSEHYPVFVTDVTDIPGMQKMCLDLGELTGRVRESAELKGLIAQALGMVRPVGDISVLYVVWKDPWMVAGKNTFINSMLELCGFRNAAVNLNGRYPVLTLREVSESAVDYILLSSEPYSFSEKDRDDLQILLPSGKVVLVDGEMFSWYGSHILKFPAYFENLRSCFG